MDSALARLNPFSRIALCGLIAEYNLTEPTGIKLVRSLLTNRARLQGFIVSDRPDLYMRAVTQLAKWVAQGKIKYHETVAQGLPNAPKALIGMLKGANLGKQLVKLV
jgi:NADPH-dependent curcumin reductase CurA